VNEWNLNPGSERLVTSMANVTMAEKGDLSKPGVTITTKDGTAKSPQTAIQVTEQVSEDVTKREDGEDNVSFANFLVCISTFEFCL
jgi:hypothetical protein